MQFGSYTGEVQDGKPNGKGSVVFNSEDIQVSNIFICKEFIQYKKSKKSKIKNHWPHPIFFYLDMLKILICKIGCAQEIKCTNTYFVYLG